MRHRPEGTQNETPPEAPEVAIEPQRRAVLTSEPGRGDGCPRNRAGEFERHPRGRLALNMAGVPDCTGRPCVKWGYNWPPPFLIQTGPGMRARGRYCQPYRPAPSFLKGATL